MEAYLKKNLDYFLFKLLTLSLFLVNPPITVFVVFHFLYAGIKNFKEKVIPLFIILLSLLLAFINSTKIPDNDLRFHGNRYLMVKDFDYLGYLSFTEKEPAFYTFNYLFFHLTDGSFNLWIMAFTIISYTLFFQAIKKFFDKLSLPKSLLIFGLMTGAFFPQLFSLSAHLIRQFLAASIFIYFAVEKIFYGKNKWWLVILGILTHTSSILLFPLVYLGFLGNYRKYGLVNILILIALIFYQEISGFLLQILRGLHPYLTYALERASQNTKFDLGEFKLMNFVLIGILVFIVVYYRTIIKEKLLNQLKKIKTTNFSRKNLVENEPSNNDNLRHFFYIMLLLMVFILANINQSELSNRLFFYVFFYVPFVFPLFLTKFKQKQIMSYLGSMAFVCYFIYRLNHGTWEYDNLFELSTNSLVSYFC